MRVMLEREANVATMEQAIAEAGRAAMRQGVQQAVRQYEEAHLACPGGGAPGSVSQGTVRRRVLTRFGRMVLHLRRQRCDGCQRRLRPAHGCLAVLGRGPVPPEFAQAGALAGASWPDATAAGVLQQVRGAQSRAEAVRRQTQQAGQRAAATQQAAAARLLQPTAGAVQAERDRQAAQARHDRATRGVRAEPPARSAPPWRSVGWDGGWVPSRAQAGGMAGTVGVVATGVMSVGKHGRQRLTPRRYVATCGSREQVGALAGAAALGLAGDAARAPVVLGAGAEWITTQAAEHFPDAVGSLDWAHGERARHQAIRAACPGAAQRARRRDRHPPVPDLLWQGDLQGAVAARRALRPAAPAEPVVVLEDTLRSLEGQRRWLGASAAWPAAGWPIGRGCIERAGAVVIHWRMNKRGMRWRRPNADGLVALRVHRLNGAWAAAANPTPLAV
jgi:hypothetical protein